MATNKKGSNNTSRIILIIAGILMICSLGYFSVQYFSQREEIRENSSKLENLRNEILDLDEQILNFQVAMDAKGDELDQKDEQLIEAQDKIEQLVKQLEAEEAKLTSSNAEVSRMKKRLSNMEKLVSKYKEEVAELKAQNLELTEAVDSLIVNESALQAENANLQDQTDRVRQERDQIKASGSVLKTTSLVINSIKRNGKLNPSDTFKPKELSSMRVCFTILDNQVADSGPRSIYMVIENPDGSTQQNTANNMSGTFRYQLRNKAYTAKKEVVYKKTSMDVCIDYGQPDKDQWQKGVHFVSLYTGEGNRIGQGKFEVK